MTTPLTADLCAIAIVAAANAYGDDPIRAVEALRGKPRRSLMAAATGLSAQLGQKPSSVCRVLGIHVASYNRSAREDEVGYRVAVKSAVRRLAEALQASPAGTVVAPPPVAPKAPALHVVATPAAPPAQARVDHTAAIAEALKRRAARPERWSVAGVEQDKLLIPASKAGGCAWPMGDPRAADFHACNAEVVPGRMYCATHAKAAGQKPVPRAIQTVGRVARPYGERDFG